MFYTTVEVIYFKVKKKKNICKKLWKCRVTLNSYRPTDLEVQYVNRYYNKGQRLVYKV